MVSTYNESDIQLAIRAHQRDPHVSILKLSKIYQVPNTTLRDRINGKPARRNTMPNSRKLTVSEENAIVSFIIDLDARSFPPRYSYVEDMANRLLAQRGGGRVGKNWTRNFINRTPGLRTRYNRRMDYSRVLCEDPNAYRAWFQRVADTMAEHGIIKEDVYNFDETGFMMGVIVSGMVVTSTERRARPRQAQQGNRDWSTAVTAVNSQGWGIPPFVILKGRTLLASWFRDTPLPDDWKLAVSENGWITNNIGLDWIKHFDEHTKERTKGSKRLLILDGHESHHSADFEAYCNDHDIITLCMPAHSSYKLQPLDVGCFSPLKRAYGRIIEDSMRRHITHVSKEDFLFAFYEAYTASITPDNIRAGFKASGLVPFDPERVISQLDIVAIVRTPSPNPSLPTQTWQSKTPNNIKEATSQSVFIKNRISAHQSSSPTSIIAGMNSFSKATYGLLHKNTLLENEVAQLRKANHLLSKRRRTKNKQLQSGGSLTVQDGIALQVANDGDEAVGQGNGEGSSRPTRAVARVRGCGVCGNTGHNARTCTIEVETDSGKDFD